VAKKSADYVNNSSVPTLEAIVAKKSDDCSCNISKLKLEAIVAKKSDDNCGNNVMFLHSKIFPRME
jgi:hypothetical protein